MKIPKLRMSEWVAPICGNKFERAGIETVGDFIEAIKTFGLRQIQQGNLAYFYFGGEDSPCIRQAGPVVWGIALSSLSELGFDWRKYLIRRGYHKCPTRLELQQKINVSIGKLIELLEKYQCSIQK